MSTFKRLNDQERYCRVDTFFVNGEIKNPEDYMDNEAAGAYRELLEHTFAGLNKQFRQVVDLGSN